MKLFSLLLGAALVSGASAAACSTCKAGSGELAKPLTCKSLTVALTCPPGSVLGGVTATPDCILCSNVNTATCEKGAAAAVTKVATIAKTCKTGYFLNGAAIPVCVKCHADCGVDGTCLVEAAPAATKCKVCGVGRFGGHATNGAACTACHHPATAVACNTAAATGEDTACTTNFYLLLATAGDAKGTCTTCGNGAKSCATPKVAPLGTVVCNPGFFANAGATACTGCQAAAAARLLPVSCETATKALTCPAGSVLGGPAASASCVACSDDTLTCTKSAELLTKASTTSTKCSPGFMIDATTTKPTCKACTAAACATATMPKKFANSVEACPLGTETADPGLAATNCGTCHGGVTCTAAVPGKAPVAALTCAATSQKRECEAEEVSLTCKATKCLSGNFGDNVADCLANCANVDGKANAAECACGKEKACKAGEGCTATDPTKKAGVCAEVKKQAAKKSPASTMQASALLSAAALLVAMRQ